MWFTKKPHLKYNITKMLKAKGFCFYQKKKKNTKQKKAGNNVPYY